MRFFFALLTLLLALPTIRVKRRGRHATLRRSAARRAVIGGLQKFELRSNFFESLILAQDERWRRALSMQVDRCASHIGA